MSQVESATDDDLQLSALYAACEGSRAALRVGAQSVGWGVLGASQIAAQRFIPALRRQPPADRTREVAGAWVAALFSHHERHGRQFAEANRIPTFVLNLADLLDRRDVHAVYISSHPQRHYTLALAALVAGKHVLCEPPLALTQTEARTLVDSAADRGLILAVNYVARANPAVRTLRQLLRDEMLGDILGGRVRNVAPLTPQQQSWRLRPNGGGAILDRTAHDVDLMRFLFGDEITLLYATAGQSILSPTPLPQVEEEIVALVQLRSSKIHLQVHDAFFLHHSPSLVELDGTTGNAIVHHWIGGQGTPTVAIQRHTHQTIVSTPQFDAYWLAIYDFQRAITAGGRPLATGEDGVENLAVIHALQRSMREKLPIRVGHAG